MHHLYETSNIPKGCNASFIAVVPKVHDPTKLDQYRPISLVGSLYKIISKVLSDRSQSTFLKDRGMLDSVPMLMR